MIEVTNKTVMAEIEAAGDKLVILDFWAAWCQPCVALGRTLAKLEAEFADRVVVLKIDADANAETANIHGVRGLPFLMLYKGGREINNRLTGNTHEAKLRSIIQREVGIA